MDDRELLKFLRTVEKGILAAYRWMPYSDEVPEHARDVRNEDYTALGEALDAIRPRLKEVQTRLLDELAA